MDNEMIERVAISVMVSELNALDVTHEYIANLWPQFAPELKNRLIRTAVSCIKSMREPTTDMLQDGNKAARDTRVSGVSGMTLEAQINAKCARERASWQAMIDAIIGDK